MNIWLALFWGILIPIYAIGVLSGWAILFLELFDHNSYSKIKSQRDIMSYFWWSVFWPGWCVKVVYEKWNELPEGEEK